MMPTILTTPATHRVKIEVPKTVIGATLQQLIDLAGFTRVENMRVSLDEQTHCVVEMPLGWAMRPGQAHSYTTWVVDDIGRTRASIFHQMDYGSRVRDRRYMEVVPRFSVDLHAYVVGKPNTRAVVVLDAGKAVYTAGTCRVDRKGSEVEARRFELERVAVQWLDTHYPRWKEAAAHWSDAPVAVTADAAA